MHAFVTVGSTRFDRLVQQALSDDVIDTLRAKGYSKIVVQCGNSYFDTNLYEQNGERWVRKDDEDIEVWRFKPSLQEEYAQADLVISHAGKSGPHLPLIPSHRPCTCIRFWHNTRCPPHEKTPHCHPKRFSHGQPSGRTRRRSCPPQPSQGFHSVVSNPTRFSALSSIDPIFAENFHEQSNTWIPRHYLPSLFSPVVVSEKCWTTRWVTHKVLDTRICMGLDHLSIWF